MRTESSDTCPACKSDLTGDPIPEKYRVHKDDCAEQKARFEGRCYCFPYGDATHGSRRIGIYDRGRDRTVAWRCPDCGHQWDR